MKNKISILKLKVKNKVLTDKKVKTILSKKNWISFIKGFLISVCLFGIGTLLNVLPASAKDISPHNLTNVENIKPKQPLWSISLYFGFTIFCGLLLGWILTSYVFRFQHIKYMNLIDKYLSFN